MRENRVAALPVVKDGRLMGIITERDFMNMAAELLYEQLDRFKD
jgi:CBS domain-containing protein